MTAWKKKLLWMLSLICVVTYLLNPILRVKTFVAFHGNDLESRIRNADEVSNYQIIDGKLMEVSTFHTPKIPEGIGIDAFDIWEGTHDMIEFRLFAAALVPSSTYYGCYYSYDDVPLPFQNAEVELIQKDYDCWVWQGEGDNRGATQKIRDHW